MTVREITQAQFDGMVSGQQQFFLDLIKKGQAKIVSDTPAPKESKPQRREAPRDSPFDRMLGKEVKLLLSTGVTMAGKLTEVWQFEVVVNKTLVLKHAIITAEVVNGDAV